MTAGIHAFRGATELLLAWTGRTIRGRYQQSLLGWFWAIVQPAASVAIFSVIFTRFVPVDTGGIPYPVFSYMAVAPWALFSSALTDMSGSLVMNMNLVTKIYFPRETLPIAAMLARLMDFGVATILLVGLMIFYDTPLYFTGMLFLPLVLLAQLLLIAGLGLIAAALNVFIRDIQPLLALAVQLLFYASPIIYPVTLVPENLRPFYFLNPMAGILESYRDILLRESLPGSYFFGSLALAVVILIVGLWFFRRVEHLFADIV